MLRNKHFSITIIILAIFTLAIAFADDDDDDSGKNNRVNIEQRVSDLETDVENLQNDVTTLQNDMTDVKTNIEDLETDTENLENELTTVQDDVGTLQSDVSAHESRITTLEQPGYTIVPFNVTLDVLAGGFIESEPIVTSGDLSFFMRCENPQGGTQQTIIKFTSAMDGWFLNGTSLLASAKPEVLGGGNGTDGEPRYDNIGAVPQSSLSTSGDFLAIQTIGLGTNIQGHDCIAIGIAFTIP